MSLLKGHCLHKGYVQMPVLRVHNWIYQSAVMIWVHSVHSIQAEHLNMLQWTPWCWNIAGPRAIIKSTI